MADKSFRGTLLFLQNKTKRDPDAYREEFLTQLRHFDAVAKTLPFTPVPLAVVVPQDATAQKGARKGGNMPAKKGQVAASQASAAAADFTPRMPQADPSRRSGAPAAAITAGEAVAADNPQFLAVLSFVCQVAACYQAECAHVAPFLLGALSQGKTALSPDTRMAFVQALVLLRSRGLVSAEDSLPVLFSLLELRDKSLRRMILTHAVGDIRRANLPGAKNGPQINKRIQNFLFTVMEEDDPVHARSAMLVMIDLYRRNVWANERTVEVLSRACFSRHSRIIRLALRFFLQQMPKFSSVNTDSDSDDGVDPGKAISKLKQKLKIKKKTRKRERVLRSKVQPLKEKFDEEKREEKYMANLEVDPIRVLREPQGFCEKLLSALQKTAERFEVRILYLSVIARVVSEHRCVVLGLYPFLERYMEPTQLHATQLLALASTAVHRDIPPDALESLVRSIANHFVNDRSDSDRITIGINTIREICKRQPLAMTPELLADLIEYKQRRGQRGVIMAARALLQLYREVYPDLLPAKLRGSALKKGQAAVVGPKGAPVFGTERPLQDIPGMDLLFAGDGNDEDEDDDAPAEGRGGAGVAARRQGLGAASDTAGAKGRARPAAPRSAAAAETAARESASSSSSDSDAEVSDVSSVSSVSTPPGSEFEAVDSDDAEEYETDADDESEGSEEATEADGDESAEASDEDAAAPPLVAAPPQRSAARKAVAAAAGSDDDIWEDSESECEAAESEPPLKKARVEAPAAPAKGRGAAKLNARTTKPAETSEEDSSSDSEIDFGSEFEIDSDGWEMVSDDEKSDDGEESDDEDNSGDSHEDGSADSGSESSTAGGPAAENSEWFVDADPKSARAASQAASSTVATAALESQLRILDDADFEKLRKLQGGSRFGRTRRGPELEAEKRLSKRQALIHDVQQGQLLDASTLETFTSNKRERDREAKIEEAREKRAAHNPFEMRRKRKTKINATHAEKRKIGKLYQMTKRSARVAEKLKRSVEERRDHRKDMDKKNIKFRIARGWKA